MREIRLKAKRLDNKTWVTGGTIIQFNEGVLSAYMANAFVSMTLKRILFFPFRIVAFTK